MTKMMIAIAMSIALPAMASAQSAPAPKKMACCEKMKEACDCCKDMAGMDHGQHGPKAGADAPSGQAKSPSPAPAPGADTHQHH